MNIRKFIAVLFVLRRGDHYYRFEQMPAFRSKVPLHREGPPVASLMPDDPIKLPAPETITHEGRDHLLAYQWRGSDERGIFIAPLVWE